MGAPSLHGRVQDRSRRGRVVWDLVVTGEQNGSPVLLVFSGARILGGAELSLLGLLTRLPRYGWEVVLTTSPGPLASRAAERGVTVLPAPWRQVRPISVKTSAAKRYSAP